MKKINLNKYAKNVERDPEALAHFSRIFKYKMCTTKSIFGVHFLMLSFLIERIICVTFVIKSSLHFLVKLGTAKERLGNSKPYLYNYS